MTDQFFAGIALIVGCLVAVPTYRWARHRKSKKRKFLEKAQRNGYCVIGEYESSKVLLGIRDSSNPRLRDDSLKVKYKYTVNGVAYYKNITFQSRGIIGTDFPIKVEVYYDPHNPKKAVCPEEVPPSEQIQTGCLTTIAVTFIAMLAVMHILRYLLG